MLGHLSMFLKNLGIVYILYLNYVNQINLPILAIVLIALGSFGMCKAGSLSKDHPTFNYHYYNAILLAFCAFLIFKHFRSMELKCVY